MSISQPDKKNLVFHPRWGLASYGAVCFVAALLLARLYFEEVPEGLNKLTASIAILGIIAIMMTVTDSGRYDD